MRSLGTLEPHCSCRAICGVNAACVQHFGAVNWIDIQARLVVSQLPKPMSVVVPKLSPHSARSRSRRGAPGVQRQPRHQLRRAPQRAGGCRFRRGRGRHHRDDLQRHRPCRRRTRIQGHRSQLPWHRAGERCEHGECGVSQSRTARPAVPPSPMHRLSGIKQLEGQAGSTDLRGSRRRKEAD